MSPYALELAEARLDALRTLIDALNEAETPEEKRRCAVAIFNTPDPCDYDDEIEVDDDDHEDDPQDENHIGEQSEDDSVVEEDSQGQEQEEESEEEEQQAAALNPLHELERSSGNLLGQNDPCAGLTDDEIIAKATALLNSGVFDHLVAPP